MTSVGFCSPELAAEFGGLPAVADYLRRTERTAADYLAAHAGDAAAAGRLRATNLGLFRAYLVHYLSEVAPTNRSMILMIRQLQPTENGLPLQLYFFTDTVDWIAYETIQSEVFEHLLAVMPRFGLRPFQRPSGDDLERLAAGCAQR